jgi:hypothetical protein
MRAKHFRDRLTGMRGRLTVRAATLLLALMMPLVGVRAPVSTCCFDDCDEPCCRHDAGQTTVTPILPCCHTVAASHATTTAPPTIVDGDPLPLAAPSLIFAPRLAITIAGSSRAPSARHLPAPPLYHQHCALLL